MTHQYLQRLDTRTLDAVFGNSGSMIAFQVGSDDADVLSRQFSKHAGQLRAEDLGNIPKYKAYARICPRHSHYFADFVRTQMRRRGIPMHG